MESVQEHLSPRIAQLQQALEDGVPSALDDFWLALEQEGTPIVEMLEGDDEYCLVTFVWRDDGNTKYVIVMGALNPFQYRDGEWILDAGEMTRLNEADLFFKTYRVRKDARFTYRFWPSDIPMPFRQSEDWVARRTTRQTDPFNPHQFVEPADEAFDSPGFTESVVELPDAPPQPWIHKDASAPSGQLDCHRFQSDILSNERRIWVYTPPGYEKTNDVASQKRYALLLLFDGWFYIHLIPTPTILDNLFHAEKLPPFVAVFLDKADPKTRSKELHCYPPFTQFIADELIPWIRTHYSVTDDPEQTIVGGVSAGGEGALYTALSHPEIFGHVISQDGAFWWSPQDDPEPQEWLARHIATTERRPSSIYLEAGLLVPYHDDTPLSNLNVNRHMRNVLQAKGYPLIYSEYWGGHHFICWRGSLADGLLSLRICS